jgi:hypothetical protein
MTARRDDLILLCLTRMVKIINPLKLLAKYINERKYLIDLDPME